MFLQQMAAAQTNPATIDCGDPATVQVFYSKMARYAVHKVQAMVGREDVAVELVQDVFIKLWQKKPVFDHEKAVYAWIYKSSHRASIDYLRSSKVKYEDTNWEFAIDTITAPNHDINLERDLVAYCLKSLKPKEVEIFCYLVFDGMTQKEIAEVQEVSLKTVQRSWLSIKNKIEKVLSKQ